MKCNMANEARVSASLTRAMPVKAKSMLYSFQYLLSNGAAFLRVPKNFTLKNT